MQLFHRRYLDLVQQIEYQFPVARWRADDLGLWPLARMDLYLDLYRSNVGITSVPSRSSIQRAIGRYATPLVNAWKSRRDLRHWIARPRPAHALFLGDGVSLDCIDGQWRDRYCDPLIGALERAGHKTFLMQQGDLSRMPWYRPTYAANLVAMRGLRRSSSLSARIDMPQYVQLMQFLAANDVEAPSLELNTLTRRSQLVLATASAFEDLLRRVQPMLAFVVTFYADLGPAFLLACRRRGILSIDLQHCPQDGAHKAYGWSALPDAGYEALPAVFWNWTQADAQYIDSWSAHLPQPWHRSLHAGHVQLETFLNDSDPDTRRQDARFRAIAQDVACEREILVALQPVSGYRAQWDALATQIEASPPQWRWWIRRHPASRDYQDEEYARLVSMRRHNVVIEQSLSVPLPTLLRHMSVVVSRFSGSSAEAAAFGVPAIFLSEEARGQFSGLIARGGATIVDIPSLNAAIARLPAVPVRPTFMAAPALEKTLPYLAQLARDYARLCQGMLTSRRNVAELRSSST